MPKDPKTMLVQTIPALSVKKNKLVRALDDGFEPIKLGFTESVERIIRSHDKMLLVDYDGLLSNRPQYDLMQDVRDIASDIDEDIELWVEAGVRQSESAIDLFIAGADSVVLCTSLLPSISEIKKSSDMSGELILSIDMGNTCRPGQRTASVISPSGEIAALGLQGLAQKCMGMGIGKIILDTAVTDSAAGAADLYAEAKALSGQAGAPEIFMHVAAGELTQGREKFQSIGIGGVIVDADEEFLGSIDGIKKQQ